LCHYLATGQTSTSSVSFAHEKFINTDAGQLKRAAVIQEQIEALNHELAGVLSGSSAPAPPKVKQYPMKIQYLIIISLFTVLLQGCIPGSQICYISPAYAGMPKSEMLHISQNYFGPSPNQFFITKINGIAGHEVSDTDLAYGSVRLSDFYLAPGT